MGRSIRVLLIAFADSIHTARWIAQLDPSLYDIHLFPSMPFRKMHEDIKHTVVHQLVQEQVPEKTVTVKHTNSLVHLAAQVAGAKNVTRLLTRTGYQQLQEQALQKVIRAIRPDLIHTMETQHAGYLLQSIAGNKSGYPKWIHSTWGIDLHYYSKKDGHRQKIAGMLQHVNLLVTEGERDIALAREAGFTGKTAIIPSVGGGFDFTLFDYYKDAPVPSLRKKILLKGYDGYERRAGLALQALRNIKHLLREYEVVIYSCSSNLLPAVEEITRLREFPVRVEKEFTYQGMLALTAEARISITNNLSDGVPNTMLEAMALGAFPIQSNTAITEGWINDGHNGLLTQPEDVDSIAGAITVALQQDGLVDAAAIYNRKLVREKLNRHAIQQQINKMYTA
jgi:glycosyltransferase involved in cell wall biosynthesis